MKRILIAVVFMIVCPASVLLVAQTPAAGKDSSIGTWKLNLAKSKYDPANLAPKSQTIKQEALEGGIKITNDLVDYTGKSLHYEMAPQYDGKDYPVKGDPNRDTISIKRIDDYTFDTVNKKAGKVTTTTRQVYSRDGKTRTITTTGTTPQGQKVSNTAIYDKQ